MKILLAVDEFKFSEAAVQAVIEQYPTPDPEISVLHVVEPTECFGYPVPESQKQRQQA
jgi:hypothetical protein